MEDTEATTVRRRRVMGVWLLAVCAMIFAMVVLGGVTRLTFSGLSMVEWEPVTGWLPPLTEAQWQAAFDAYREYPEYQKVNAGMALAGFKSIFWMEYLHRLWGRLIGLAYAVPFAVFLLRGWMDRPLILRAGIGLLLGGFQGWLGWYMVQSGLVDRPDVSAYRLTAHLAAALAIHGYLFWLALGLLGAGPRLARAAPVVRRAAVLVLALVCVTILSGGFVAGLDAGFAYNTFPTMDGDWLPPGLYGLEPFWLSAFEDIATVQFNHRMLAMATLAATAWFWWRARGDDLSAAERRVIDLLGLAAAAQAGLGLITLLWVVPILAAAAHQAVAVALFTIALRAVRATRRRMG
jgi:cytochrome c oxidase assembly protein subunit 15